MNTKEKIELIELINNIKNDKFLKSILNMCKYARETEKESK